VLERYVWSISGAGLVITGRTEHNAPDFIPMESTCVGGLPVPENMRRIFWEGACVVTAHQFPRLIVEISGPLESRAGYGCS
jgi:hypothetical protein